MPIAMTAYPWASLPFVFTQLPLLRSVLQVFREPPSTIKICECLATLPSPIIATTMMPNRLTCLQVFR
jgi:hypothetical protein